MIELNELKISDADRKLLREAGWVIKTDSYGNEEPFLYLPEDFDGRFAKGEASINRLIGLLRAKNEKFQYAQDSFISNWCVANSDLFNTEDNSTVEIQTKIKHLVDDCIMKRYNAFNVAKVFTYDVYQDIMNNV